MAEGSAVTTSAVNIGTPGVAWDVYVGRGRDPRTGEPPQVDWGNPFVLQEGTTRREVIERHFAHVLERPWLVDRIRAELRGLALGCWCKPKACHGDTLALIADSEPAGHVQRKCDCRDDGTPCSTCAGLSSCLLCRGGEGALTSECPGAPYDSDAVYDGRLNFIFGRWVSASRPPGGAFGTLTMPCAAGKIHWRSEE